MGTQKISLGKSLDVCFNCIEDWVNLLYQFHTQGRMVRKYQCFGLIRTRLYLQF